MLFDVRTDIINESFDEESNFLIVVNFQGLAQSKSLLQIISLSIFDEVFQNIKGIFNAQVTLIATMTLKIVRQIVEVTWKVTL